jgi:hypothetical protein
MLISIIFTKFFVVFIIVFLFSCFVLTVQRYDEKQPTAKHSPAFRRNTFGQTPDFWPKRRKAAAVWPKAGPATAAK